MERVHLPDLTIILTCRIDSYLRHQNALTAIRFYQKYTDAKIMLLEADDSSKIGDEIHDYFPEVEYIFIEDHNPIFHRTHYINLEMIRASTKNTANIDVDAIVPPAQLVAANSVLLNGNDVMVLPYDGRFVCQSACRSDLFRHKVDIRIFEEIPGNSQLMYGYISVGGAYLVNVERYKQCGLENEYFIGWGPEDYERFIRLDILGHKPIQIPGVIYHLEHPRGINSGDKVENVVLATKREYCTVCSMMPEELKEYIKSWPWIRL